MPTDAKSGCPVTGHNERKRSLHTVSATGEPAAASTEGSTSERSMVMAWASRLSPSTSAMRSLANAGGAIKATATGASTAWLRSRAIVADTASALGEGGLATQSQRHS